MGINVSKKDAGFPINLYFSLMLLSFIPFIYTLVRTNLIADVPLPDGLGIAGHIEWFDLINETIQAFLIVPLFGLFNKCVQGTRDFKERAFQLFLIANGIYILFSAIIFVRCKFIVSVMTADQTYEVTKYLQLETIGFIVANAVSFANVLFVVLGKTAYIYAIIVLKTVLTIFGDLFWIPQFGVNGIAYSNIAVSSACVILCLFAIYRERLMVISFRFSRTFVKDYAWIGLFSGSQVLLDNIIYTTIVCKMVNQVSEQGNYWAANNIIWGLMLIPISALSEIIKKECQNELSTAKIKRYHLIIIVTFFFLLCFIPMLNPFLKNIMGLKEFKTVKHIIMVLIPFYLAYSYTALLDSLLIGYGKTQYLFFISGIVNLIYYPIVYGLVLKGIFVPNILFICIMFGSGMVIHLCCSVIYFILHTKKRKTIFLQAKR